MSIRATGKTLFVAGERVLCFEPDPTKAKVLYESKVLDVDWTKDDKGKKVPEYLVHFNGWNHSWDRWAPEEFVLKDSDENRDLQARLQKEAEEKIKKKKKKKKLAELIEETRLKNLKGEKKSGQDASSESEADTGNENGNSSEEDDREPEDVPIQIPDILKAKLEEDCYFINSKKQLVQLPVQPNIITIFENYLRYFALNVHMSEKHRPQASTNVVHGLYANKTDGPQNVAPEHNNELVKEILEDLRVIFDFALPLVLLYGCERTQYTKVSTSTFLPVLPAKKQEEDDDLSGDPEISFKSLSTPKSSKPPKRSSSPPPLSPEYSLPTKIIKREIIEDIEVLTPTRRITRRQSTELRTAEKGSPALPITTSTPTCGTPSRGELRRRGDSKTSHSQTTASPSMEKSVPTRHSTRTNPQQAAPSQQTQQQTSQQTTGQTVAQTCPQPLCMGGSGGGKRGNVSVCSSSRSTPGICEVSNCSWNLRDCTDVLSWTLLPSDFAYEGPTPPCLIYGAQHLLRMFVKLPEILGRMKISPKSLKPLVRHLEGIVKYLALPDNMEELFIDTVYVDAGEVYGNFKKPVASH